MSLALAVESPAVEHINVSIRRAYSDALTFQNACNFSGIAMSLGSLAETVCYDLSMNGPPNAGTATKNRHPVFVLFASKLHDMAGLGISDVDRYGIAYHFAEKVAQGVLTVGSESYCQALAAYYREWDLIGVVRYSD